MKKVITVCLCLILALSALVVACAEDFTLHAGTMFGDTKEQVKEKENNTDVEEFVYNENISHFLYTGITIAGYENCDIHYYFDNTKDYLFDVSYFMGGSVKIGEDALLNRLGELGTLLIEKYGKPLSNEDEVNCLISGWTRNKTNYDFDYIGWSVPCGDYNVKIELVITYDFGKPFSLNIDYHQYTDEEFEMLKNGNNETDKDIDDTGTHSADDL